MIRLVALLSCIGLICAATTFNPNALNEKVIGGYDAPPNKWLWQVSLQYDSYARSEYYHICGGTLIDHYHIMTAAHCMLSMDASLFRVVLGEYNLVDYDGTEQYSAVEKIFVHPGWTGDYGKGNDITIMRLVDPVYNTGFVATAELPYPGQVLPHDFQCYITGWGLITIPGSPNYHSPAILQEAPMKVVEHSVCSKPDWWGSNAQETMVCAGGDGYTSGCQGDSGGPLSCFSDGEWRVHGVVSYGPAGECNQVKKPTVFTRVSAFQDWIHEVISS